MKTKSRFVSSIYKTQLENIDTQFSNIEYMSYSRLMKHEDSIDTQIGRAHV